MEHDTNTKFKSLLRIAFRPRVFLLVFLGASFTLASFLVGSNWNEVLLQLGMVFLGVGAVETVALLSGGDPQWVNIENNLQAIVKSASENTEIAVNKLSGTTNAAVKELMELSEAVNEIKMLLKRDSLVRETGIERLWVERKQWQSDPEWGLARWKDLICDATEVDIVSNTLWNNWFEECEKNDFVKDFFKGLASKTKVRILLYHPLSWILYLRAKDEEDDPADSVSEQMWPTMRLYLSSKGQWDLQRMRKLPPPKKEMHEEIGRTLACIRDQRMELKSKFPDIENKLEVHLTSEYYHLAQVVRVRGVSGDAILVVTYLSGLSGSHAPTFLLRGRDKAFFDVYRRQIDKLMVRGIEVSDAQITSILDTMKEIWP